LYDVTDMCAETCALQYSLNVLDILIYVRKYYDTSKYAKKVATITGHNVWNFLDYLGKIIFVDDVIIWKYMGI
jgi:hypothetical protein